MKKLTVIALALVGMMACNNETVVNAPATLITFDDSFVVNKTRAAEDPSITTASIDAFDVWGFVDNTTGMILEQERVSKGAEGWTYENLQYWTGGHNYYFGAVAPVDHENIVVDIENGNEYGLGEITFTNNDGTDDLIYASKKVTTPDPIVATPEAVKLQFAHLLSKIKFSFTNAFMNKSVTLKVTNIQITNAPKTATINLAQEGWMTKDAWSKPEGTCTLSFGDGEKGATIGQGETVESDYERLTIPTGADYTYTVSFDVEMFMGEVSADVFHKSVTLENQALKIGKNYNFKATFDHTNVSDDETDLSPIQFDIVVEEWVEDTEANTDLNLNGGQGGNEDENKDVEFGGSTGGVNA